MFTKEYLESLLKEKENVKLQLEGLFHRNMGQIELLRDMLKKLEEPTQPK